jgi:hypothetical protein
LIFAKDFKDFVFIAIHKGGVPDVIGKPACSYASFVLASISAASLRTDEVCLRSSGMVENTI